MHPWPAVSSNPTLWRDQFQAPSDLGAITSLYPAQGPRYAAVAMLHKMKTTTSKTTRLCGASAGARVVL